MLLLIKLDEPCPKKKDKTLTKHLRLRGLLGVGGGRFSLSICQKADDFLLFVVLRDFVVVVVVVVVSDGFSTPFMPFIWLCFTLVTLGLVENFCWFSVFWKTEKSLKCNLPNRIGDRAGPTRMVCVCVCVYYIYDCPILHNSALSSCFMNGEPSSE